MGIFTSLFQLHEPDRSLYKISKAKLWYACKLLLTTLAFLTWSENEVKAQCNNAITSGNFSDTPLGEYTSVGNFQPAPSSDPNKPHFINIVNNNGSRGARIKGSLNYSLQQTLNNLQPGISYTISFDISLFAGNCPSANTALQVEVKSGITSLALLDFNANSNGIQPGAITFITPANGDPITIIFSDPKANKPSCGAVIDNLFIYSPLSVSSTQQNVGCFGQSTGSFTVTGTGGAGSYKATYVKPGNATAVPITVVNQAGTANNLPAGTYTVTLEDANGCPKETIVTITQPAALVVNAIKTDVRCSGGSDGTISLNPAGGTAP